MIVRTGKLTGHLSGVLLEMSHAHVAARHTFGCRSHGQITTCAVVSRFQSGCERAIRRARGHAVWRRLRPDRCAGSEAGRGFFPGRPGLPPDRPGICDSHGESDDTPAFRLVSCDAGSVIELFDDRGSAPSSTPRPAAQPLQFVSDDVLHAAQWLQRDGASIIGLPHRVTSGPLAGRMVLDFVSPWGLRLQLVGSGTHPPAAGALATVDGRYDGG